ncbi:MAG: hypothetical protein SV966_04760, partial [Actinomycetota bacterium]|nr:hypothetical protein [Actinomycetota bacterium]
RKRARGAPTHVRSWPLRPNPTQRREIGIRFFTGVRVYNAVPASGATTLPKSGFHHHGTQSGIDLPHAMPGSRRINLTLILKSFRGNFHSP